MRIIGGKYRSRTLQAPKGMETRPTLDQVREALFNILQGQIEGIVMLDLYGGSGAVALEAVSRGASAAVISDQSRDAVAVMKKNVAALACQDQVTVLQMKDQMALDRLEKEQRTFDLVFLDPPYKMDMTDVLTRIAAGPLLRPGGKAVLEHAASNQVPEIHGLRLLSTRKYRDTCLTFYEKE